MEMVCLCAEITSPSDGMVPRELVRGGAAAAARGAGQVPRGGVPPPRRSRRRHRHAAHAQLHQEGRLHVRHRHRN